MDKNKIQDIVAENLKNLLNQAGLSPSALTKKCNVSSASLSKIIKGNMSITIPMAMQIAEGLGVSLNRLLEGLVDKESPKINAKDKKLSKREQLSIGILSINNRRMCCIKNHKNMVIGTSELEGGLDLTETTSELLEAIQESIHNAFPNINTNSSKQSAIKLNLVTQSFEFEETRSKFKNFAERNYEEVNLLPDWVISYLASFENNQGISLITDKGVSLSFRVNAEIKKLGGWKFPVYDIGGENWLGVETIRHTIQAKEGYIPMSNLAHNVLAKFSGKIEKITEFCFKPYNPDIYCFFSDLLLRSYFTGDSSAKAIINNGYEQVCKLIERADALIGKKTKIALGGSLTDIYKPYFDQERLIVPSSESEKANKLADLTKDILLENGVIW